MGDTSIEVGHCGGCPGYVANETGGGLCRFAAWTAGPRAGKVWPDDPERPEWCPLEKGPITIRLRAEVPGG